MPSVPVRALLGDPPGLRLAVLAGESGLDRAIAVERIQKPGLALAGFTRQVHTDRVQVLGATEIEYVASLAPEVARASLLAFARLKPACIVVTKGLEVPPLLLEAAASEGVALLRSPLTSSLVIESIHGFLSVELAPRASLHAVLMDVLGIGVLITGASGIGKSEAALELIMRGHRLVADDLVEVRRLGKDSLVGWASDLIKHHMEVRGLGIINIKDMFGVAAVRDEKKIEMALELLDWRELETDRLGTDELTKTILDVPLPLLRIPVRPGRAISSLVEVACRNRLLQVRGHHSAREFQERLDRALAEARLARLANEVE